MRELEAAGRCMGSVCRGGGYTVSIARLELDLFGDEKQTDLFASDGAHGSNSMGAKAVRHEQIRLLLMRKR